MTRSPRRGPWCTDRSAALALAALGAMLAVAATARAGSFLESQTLVHDGVTRWYDLYVPDGLDGTPVPLLLVLHGGTQSNDVFESGAALELRRLADAERFVMVLPNATSAGGGSGPSGSFNWNDCRSDAGAADTSADDTSFVARLIDEISARHAIDAQRVYATGASNGGMMSYRLALELSDRIAAIAASVANLPGNSECPAAPAQPLSVLIMNGTADPIMPWGGGQVSFDRGLVLSAEATRDFWRERLGTAATPQRNEFPDLDPDDVGTVTSELYTGGREGSVLLFYAVAGGGHTAPSIAYPTGGMQNHDVEAVHEFWRFLADKRLAGQPVGGRESGLQVTPGARQTLISKDVGGERWAIAYEPESGDVIGNVFQPGGGAPRFVTCKRTAENPSAALLTFACSGAEPCVASPCDPAQWTPLGEVELPVTFFWPPFAGD